MNETMQLSLDLRPRPHGGARKGAGRKPRAERVGYVEHLVREKYDGKYPVHITVRAVSGVPSLRSERIFAALRAIFATASEKGFRLLHFSVQVNHLHIIAEADDGEALSRGMQRLLSHATFAVNRIAGRTGKLWRDRYHRHDLKTPTAVRNALVYVLFNVRKHDGFDSDRLDLFMGLDPCSSAAWLDPTGWREGEGPSEDDVRRAGPSIVAEPTSWMARVGWKKSRFGLLRIGETPVIGH